MLRTAAAILLCLTVPALAQDAPKPLTVQQAIDVTNGLMQLDKYEDCTGVPADKPCTHYYKFSATARWTIGLNIEAGKREAQTYNNVRTALILEYGNGAPKVPDEMSGKFHAEDSAMLDKPSNVTFGRIKKADLRLEENPIPGTVIALIHPIVEE